MDARIKIPRERGQITRVRDLIRLRYGHLRGARKVLARLAGCSHRTTEAWLAGRSDPHTRHMTAIMRADPSFGERLLRFLEEMR